MIFMKVAHYFILAVDVLYLHVNQVEYVKIHSDITNKVKFLLSSRIYGMLLPCIYNLA